VVPSAASSHINGAIVISSFGLELTRIFPVFRVFALQKNTKKVKKKSPEGQNAKKNPPKKRTRFAAATLK